MVDRYLPQRRMRASEARKWDREQRRRAREWLAERRRKRTPKLDDYP